MTTRKAPSTPDDYSRGIASALAAWLREVGAEPDQVIGIVHEHEGAIRCDSAVGQGTRFILSFPLVSRSSDVRSVRL